MGDDALNVTVNAAAKAPEFARSAAELLETLVKMLKELHAFGASKTPLGKLKDAAVKANANVMSEIIPKSQQKAFEKIAASYGLQAAFGKAGKEHSTVYYSSNYAAQFKAAFGETLKETLKADPRDYSTVKINSCEAAMLKKMCESRNLPANIAKSGDNYLLVYQNRDSRSIEMAVADCGAWHKEARKYYDCGFDEKRGQFFISNQNVNKTLWLSSFKTESKIENILRDRFGIDEFEAMFVAKKFGASLTDAQRTAYVVDSRQAELLKELDVNLKRGEDSPLLRDLEFSRVKFKSDDKERIVVSNGADAVMLIPANMKREEIEKLAEEKLGVNTATAMAIYEKSAALHGELANKTQTIGERGAIEIEKMSGKEFKVSQGEKIITVAFADRTGALELLQRRFGVSAGKAAEIFDKAKAQNAVANAMKRAGEVAAKKPAPKSSAPKIGKKPKRV